MDNIFIKKELSTPKVVLDAQKGLILFEGKSRPEDPDAFFVPITDWLLEYVKNPKQKTVVDFKFSYFNTSSSKKLIEILMILDIAFVAGKELEINWYFKAIDEDMQEDGEMFDELNEAPINLIPVS